MATGLLQGKVAVITGSTRGLGLAVAQACAREGAAVVVASRTPAMVEQTVSSLKTAGFQVTGQPCDVGELPQVEALAAHAVNTFGRLDVWVNNAGVVAAHGPTAHVPPQEIIQVIRTNILGTYFGSLVALRAFLPQGQGKLVNFLGRGARRPVPYGNAYASSKAWVRSFTHALAKEYKDTGVGIYAFNPGLVNTDVMRNFRVIAGYEKRGEMFKTVIRLWAEEPEVVAEKVVWLVSGATDSRTGLEVDMLGVSGMLRGVLREGARRLTRRPAPPVDLSVTTVPAAITAPAQP